MSKNRLQKKNGFMLIEMLVAIVVVVMLAVGMGTGLNAAVKAYKESTQQSDDAVLTDILNTTMGDMLRYCEDVKLIKNESGEITGFTFTNYDYGIKDGWLAVENGKVVIKYQKEGESEPASIPLVNDGAYTEGIQVGDLVVTPDEEGKYYDISYSLIRNGEKDQYTFRVRQANADIVAIIEDQGEDGPSTENPGGNGGQSGEGEETESDSQITVTFDCNIQKGEGDRKVFENVFGDKTSSVSKVVNGSFNTNIGNVVRAGYALNGWYAVSQSGSRKTFNKYNPDEPETIKVSDIGSYVDGDTLILYAEWEAVCDYKIVFEKNLSDKVSDMPDNLESKGIKATEVCTLTWTKVPKSVGYTFLGWTINSKDGELNKTLKSYQFSNGQAGSETTVTLYAHWKEITVSFVTNGGSAVGSRKASHTTGKISLPTDNDTKKTGYSLNGWYSDEAKKNKVGDSDNTYTPTADITLYAGWSAKKYTVEFYPNGGTKKNSTSADKTTQAISYDKETALNDNPFEKKFTITFNSNGGSSVDSKTVYAKFDGWCVQGNLTNVVYTNQQKVRNLSDGGTVKLYAHWSGNKLNSSNWPSDPTKTGYKFTGWYVGDERITTDKVFTDSLELTAHWERIKVTLNANNGVNKNGKAEMELEASTTDGTVTLNLPTRTGYNFNGWYTLSEGGNRVGGENSKYPSSGKLTDNVTLYAQWTGWTYYVRFNGNGATGGNMDNEEFTYGTSKPLSQNLFTREYTITLNPNSGTVSRTSVKAIWTWNGWAELPAGTAVYGSTTPVGNLVTTEGATKDVYAVWSGGTADLIDPTKTGWHFNRWVLGNCTDTKGKKTADNNTVFSSNTTVSAEWKCTVTLNADGGKVNDKDSDSTEYFYTGKTITATLPDAKDKKGYTFAGWGTSKDYTVNGDAILTAKWNRIVVKFDANGGTCDQGPRYASESDGTITLPTANRVGHKFLGWSETKDGPVIGAPFTPSSSTTLYAKWETNKYRLYVNRGEKHAVDMSLKYWRMDIGDWSEELMGDNSFESDVYYGTLFKFVYNRIQGSKVGIKEFSVSDNLVLYLDSGCTNKTTLSKDDQKTVYFTMPAGEAKIKGTGTCFAAGTLITLADGTKKKIEDFDGTEKLLSWDFYQGRFIEANVIVLNNHGENYYNVIHLNFSDQSEVQIIGQHGFFDETECRFVYIDESNWKDYIGDSFSKETESTILVGAYVTEEKITSYSIWASGGMSVYANDFLTVGPDGPNIGVGLFEITEEKKYSEADIVEQVLKYGTYCYEDLSDYVTKDEFDAFNMTYVTVLEGKGLVTKEKIVYYIENYVRKGKYAK